jgi:hypothetical protein
MKGRDRVEASRDTFQSIERLVRSLVGVAGAAITVAPDGSIDSLTITPEPGSSERQVLQNVTSALLAGLGVDIPASRMRIGDAGAIIAATNGRHPAVKPDPGPAATQAAPARRDEQPVKQALPAPRARTRTSKHLVAEHVSAAEPAAAEGEEPQRQDDGSVRDHAGQAPPITDAASRFRRQARSSALARPAGFSNVKTIPLVGAAALAAVDESMPEVTLRPRLEQLELHCPGNQLRCHVLLAVGPERFLAIAESFDTPGAAIELAARVTLDALRAARIPTAPIQFAGAAIAEIGTRPHVVVSVQIWTGQAFEPHAGAAAANHSFEEAAALAVLQAINSRP